MARRAFGAISQQRFLKVWATAPVEKRLRMLSAVMPEGEDGVTSGVELVGVRALRALVMAAVEDWLMRGNNKMGERLMSRLMPDTRRVVASGGIDITHRRAQQLLDGMTDEEKLRLVEEEVRRRRLSDGAVDAEYKEVSQGKGKDG